MEAFLNVVAGILIVIGAGFSLAAGIGLIRLPDVYTRMHAASKTGTLGSGLMLIAMAVFAEDAATILRCVAAVIFFLLTAPLSAHLLGKAAYAAGYKMWDGTIRDEMAAAKDAHDLKN